LFRVSVSVRVRVSVSESPPGIVHRSIYAKVKRVPKAFGKGWVEKVTK